MRHDAQALIFFSQRLIVVSLRLQSNRGCGHCAEIGIGGITAVSFRPAATRNVLATQPAFKFRLGLITATVWDNDGFYSVDLSRSYRDKEGVLVFHCNRLVVIATYAERTTNYRCGPE